MLLDNKVKDFVDDVASSKPAPGGGSVAALTSSLGSALTAMVGNLTIGRKTYGQLTKEQKEILEQNFARSQELMKILNRLTEDDTTAFNGVMEAFKLPKDTEDEKKQRSEEIQNAMKEALEVPLTVAKESLEVLKIQKSFGEFGNSNAITDVGVGALLAYAGLEGALFNVLINLQSIKDEEYVEEVRKKCNALKSEGNRLKEETLEVVYGKLN